MLHIPLSPIPFQYESSKFQLCQIIMKNKLYGESCPEYESTVQSAQQEKLSQEHQAKFPVEDTLGDKHTSTNLTEMVLSSSNK